MLNSCIGHINKPNNQAVNDRRNNQCYSNSEQCYDCQKLPELLIISEGFPKVLSPEIVAVSHFQRFEDDMIFVGIFLFGHCLQG
jgi:hypothetical protein